MEEFFVFAHSSEAKTVSEVKMKKGISINLKLIGDVAFYAGILLEVLIMMLDKCAWINPYEGWMFRITFLLFAFKVFVTPYTKKEKLVIILAGLFAAVCYFVSTRDEVVRTVVFVASLKGIDGKKALKTVFWSTVAGMVILALLSMVGVLGTVIEQTDGYGFKMGRTRICLGVGCSNTLSIMIWALMTLGIYLYHESMKLWHYGVLLAATMVTYAATLTRTSLLMTIATLLMAVFMQYFKKLREAAWVYIGSIVAVFGCIGFSVWAAYVSAWYEQLDEWVIKIDAILTNRIVSLYAFSEGGARLENWKLFGDPTYVNYFDMGYVRLFFWYGIIPGIVCVTVLCLLLWNFRKNKDYMGFVLTFSFAVFTVVEAHAVSVYIARNYVLFLLGMYWIGMLGKNANETNWWTWLLPKRKGISG